MTLTDTSVLIELQRKQEPELRNLLNQLEVLIAGLVRSEMLAGSRTIEAREDTLMLLNSFQQYNITPTVWDALGDNLAILRSKGVTVPFQDALLATIAIELDVELWSRDKHFPLMQTALPRLKLYQEPA